MKFRQSLATALLGAVLLSVTAGCSASEQTGAAESSPRKPDLPDISDRMFLAETDFPTVPDGKYLSTPVRTMDGSSEPLDRCDPDSWLAGGGQEAGSRVISESTNARYNIEIFHAQTKVDLAAWARDCLPLTDDDDVIEVLELPGLPTGTVGMTTKTASDGEARVYQAVGYIRGVLVAAYVRKGDTGMPAGAKSDLVRIFNAQAAKLQDYA
ncbi:hypothetical protein JNN96_33040 [Mycobacterium sp. DSM 3803]|nr:hypothetical protein [Mycobacterium sp. DSM 3803]